MNDLRKPLNRGGLARPPEDVDALLRRFFRAEMPEPWPAPPAVPTPAASVREPQRRPSFRLSSRLALAAAVALFVIGYLALAARFPASPNVGPDPIRPDTGFNVPRGMGPFQKRRVEELPREVVPLRGGGAAEIRGVREQGPRKTIHLHVERIR